MLRFMEKKKNPHAKAMGKARWKGVPPEERSRIAKAAVDAREAKRAAKAKVEPADDLRNPPPGPQAQ